MNADAESDGMLQLVNRIIWFGKTRLKLSFLLAFLSWVFLTLLWNMTDVGSPAFKFIAAIVRPGWTAGHYLAVSFFGNDSQHRPAAVLMSLGCLLVMYTAFWYVVIVTIRRMWSHKPSDSDKGFSQP